jgi:hypothetical protein
VRPIGDDNGVDYDDNRGDCRDGDFLAHFPLTPFGIGGSEFLSIYRTVHVVPGGFVLSRRALSWLGFCVPQKEIFADELPFATQQRGTA